MKNISPLFLAMAISGGLFSSNSGNEYSQCDRRGCWAYGKKGEPYEKTCKACSHFKYEEKK